VAVATNVGTAVKIFWSWQFDTYGPTGRHLVREALEAAIALLKQAPDVEEPTEQERREAMHLDHDRKGVSGSPELARTIFEKIDRAEVFVADVTAVGQTFDGTKKLMNSNVAIEYGHAHKALGDTKILMVQNQHYGTRDDLPFDLKHHAGPIQYSLGPDADKEAIAAEKIKLRGQFITALRPYLETTAHQEPFAETQSIGTPATFFEPHEILGRIAEGTRDEIEYQFGERRAFYLRLMPMAACPKQRTTQLMDVASRIRPDVLSSARYGGTLDRNRFGVIAIEGHGTSRVPRSLTQMLTTGEIWGVTRQFFAAYREYTIVPTVALENTYRRVLQNYCELLAGLNISPPYTVECGAIGLQGLHVGIGNNGIDGPIHGNNLQRRFVLHDTTKDTLSQIARKFVDDLLDLAGVSRT
jgi:hypothetical protein